MASFNSCTLLGTVVRDPEIHYTASGMAICELCVVVNDRRKQGDDWVDEASFLDCTCFGKTAEVAAEYVGKGKQILVNGRLKQDNWKDKDTGQKRSKIKITVDRLVMVGSKQDSYTQDSPPGEGVDEPAKPAANDTPF